MENISQKTVQAESTKQRFGLFGNVATIPIWAPHKAFTVCLVTPLDMKGEVVYITLHHQCLTREQIVESSKWTVFSSIVYHLRTTYLSCSA